MNSVIWVSPPTKKQPSWRSSRPSPTATRPRQPTVESRAPTNTGGRTHVRRVKTEPTTMYRDEK
jgi:hypothetical protein